MLRQLDGGCSVPIGCETTIIEEIDSSHRSTSNSPIIISRPSTPYDKHSATITLTGTITSLAGTSSVIATATKLVHSLADAEALGLEIALQLVAKGGRVILEELGKHIKEVGGEEGKEIPFEANTPPSMTYSTEMRKPVQPIEISNVSPPSSPTLKSSRPRSLTYPGDQCQRPAGW